MPTTPPELRTNAHRALIAETGSVPSRPAGIGQTPKLGAHVPAACTSC